MPRILITGSTDGLGRAAALSLLEDGHEVVVHARTEGRLTAADDLIGSGARSVIGNLANLDEVHDLARQANAIGVMDAVIHNAGVINGPVLAVNVVAPYLLTAALDRPGRLIYLSSSMHRGGSPDLTGADWGGDDGRHSYSDSKLFVTALMAAVAERWEGTIAHAVDPGWVPTRMGGPSASDDLRLGHVTQAWLAVSDDPEALTTGRYWHHQRVETPHPAVYDTGFQEQLLEELAEHTGVGLPTRGR
ncbi:SDR family NAD(P)-dependent oxidoreductase [Kocuria coralli]|uniref:SDR family NAD(P)-dependent oxidoreductase n=1 Tax=Kocuria coralli TaxID=1461025 RepID=A0A5J5KYD5_9MICC|nr:SDR family NAD(P)-dependent oxidoreductase [Kocuria coralli]KAA9394532.1 SDR family NAD(P)-dependent oxidoreductase [Kocuria coralli]